MLRSMTAFGSSHLALESCRIVVQIRSVNRKHLDIIVDLPSEISHLEGDVRKWISEVGTRGHITVKGRISFETNYPLKVKANIPFVQAVQAACQEVGDKLGLKNTDALAIQMLAVKPEWLLFEETEEGDALFKDKLEKGVKEALHEWLLMKVFEGHKLAEDILARLKLLADKIPLISSLADEAVDKFRQKLHERLNEIIPGVVENEDKLLREVCVYAEKVDITEEIVRFQSHVEQFRNYCQSGELSSGKTLEFLLHEMQREVNTIGSKSAHTSIARAVVEMKSEMEKIREQLQNVE